MTSAAELRILQRARRQPSVETRPESPALVLTAPVRRFVQAPLFVGIALAPAATEEPRQRRLWSVP